MAYSFDVNETPATGAVAMYQLIAKLLAAGWTKLADSDGTTYSSGGTQVTGGGTGAHGLNNVDAWVRLHCPSTNGNTRELTIQRIADATAWRIKYSAAAGFTGGSPGTARTPTATDEIVIAGGGTDAAPTGTAIFDTDGSYRCHVAAGGAVEGYTFLLFCTTTGSSFFGRTLFFLDTMQVFDAGDVDPTVIFLNSFSGGLGESDFTAGAFLPPTGMAAWLGPTNNPANWVRVHAWIVSFNNSTALAPPRDTSTSQTGQLPFSGKDPTFLAQYGRSAAFAPPLGPKGYGTLVRYAGVTRNNYDTLNTAAAKDRVYITGLSFPWPTGVDPIL